MPSYLWSNPNPNQSNTQGELSSRGSPIGPAAPYGELIKAIIAKQANEERQWKEAAQGIQAAAKGYQSYQDRGQAQSLGEYQDTMSQPMPEGLTPEQQQMWHEEVAQSAADPYGQLNAQGQLKADAWSNSQQTAQEKLHAEMIKQQMQDQLTQAKIDSLNRGTSRANANDSGDGTTDTGSRGVKTIQDESGNDYYLDRFGGAHPVKQSHTIHPSPNQPAQEQAQEKAAVQAPGKALDAQTASQFLNQAGGDKAKARALATAAGYSF